MKKVKGFSYDTEKDKDLIEHIGKQPNYSQYIWSLVRKDMNKESIESLIQKEIQKYLDKFEINSQENEAEIDSNEVINILNM